MTPLSPRTRNNIAKLKFYQGGGHEDDWIDTLEYREWLERDTEMNNYLTTALFDEPEPKISDSSSDNSEPIGEYRVDDDRSNLTEIYLSELANYGLPEHIIDVDELVRPQLIDWLIENSDLIPVYPEFDIETYSKGRVCKQFVDMLKNKTIVNK